MRAGVIGVGSMGRHHVRIVSELPDVNLVGCFDTDFSRAQEYGHKYCCSPFATIDELLDNVDAVTIAAPTSLHVKIGETCLQRGVHVMMEKPLADSPQGAAQLVKAANAAGVALMVGHVERYNPAIRGLMEALSQGEDEIVSIDTRRLAPFDGSRCLDADVLYDLLVHDVDLVLEIADSPVVRVSAAGRPVFSDKMDFVHALIEFENRAVATLWAGKCSPKKVRTVSVSTNRRFLEADTLSNTLCVWTAEETPSVEQGCRFMGDIHSDQVAVPGTEPLRNELEDFFAAIREGGSPIVDGNRALRSLEVLELIKGAISDGS